MLFKCYPDVFEALSFPVIEVLFLPVIKVSWQLLKCYLHQLLGCYLDSYWSGINEVIEVLSSHRLVLCQVSVLARQQGNRLEKFQTQAGDHLEMLHTGLISAKVRIVCVHFEKTNCSELIVCAKKKLCMQWGHSCMKVLECCWVLKAPNGTSEVLTNQWKLGTVLESPWQSTQTRHSAWKSLKISQYWT